MSWWTVLALWAVYWMALWILPASKMGNGYTGRILFRWVHRRNRYIVRFMCWWGVSLVVSFLWHRPFAFSITFWPVAIGFIADDYYFGDDDERKKRWDAVKNKIKWLMDLPKQPEGATDHA